MKLFNFIWYIGVGSIFMMMMNSCVGDNNNNVKYIEGQKVAPVVDYIAPRWICPDCTHNEKYVLNELQNRTNITDKLALSTLLGNIQQESRFKPDVCEGGERMRYQYCKTGGYGIIQWTTPARYNGLGAFCNKFDCDPTTLSGQVRYMVNEEQFRILLPKMETRGKSIRQYMTDSYQWLGWGIKGSREHYAHDYSKMLIQM